MYIYICICTRVFVLYIYACCISIASQINYAVRLQGYIIYKLLENFSVLGVEAECLLRPVSFNRNHLSPDLHFIEMRLVIPGNGVTICVRSTAASIAVQTLRIIFHRKPPLTSDIRANLLSEIPRIRTYLLSPPSSKKKNSDTSFSYYLIISRGIVKKKRLRA